MFKYALAILIILNLMGCGKTHYEYFVGEKGDKGEQGASGSQGNQGPQGIPGIDATSVTVIKLCPGVTTYPSRFVEVAFCIGGTLYGTYSANGGFSTEMPSGTYGSNGINASCNFTVAPNCTIVNN